MTDEQMFDAVWLDEISIEQFLIWLEQQRTHEYNAGYEACEMGF